MITRSAKTEDAKNISSLMGQLGYRISSSVIENKLRQFSENCVDSVYVVELEGEIVGCISCHITSLFHQEGNSGRITSLVVDENCRREGVGKLLVKAADQFFQSMDCIKSEVTSGSHRHEAHSFYEKCGFKIDERRFIKIYS